MDMTLEILTLNAEHAAKLLDALRAAIAKPEVRDLVTPQSIGRMEANLDIAHSAATSVRITLQANAQFNAERAALKNFGVALTDADRKQAEEASDRG